MSALQSQPAEPGGPQAARVVPACPFPVLAVLAFAQVLVLAGVVLNPARPPARQPARAPGVPAEPATRPAGPDPAELRAQAWQRVEARLDALDQQLEARLDADVAMVRRFLLRRRQTGARAFAEEVLSLSGKWALARSHLPWASGDEHLRYLAAQFHRHLFEPEALLQVVRQAVLRHVQAQRDAEDQLLLQLRLDLADLPDGALPVLASGTTLEDAYARLLDQTRAKVATDLGVDVGREVLSATVAEVIATQVAGRVLGAVATRLGLSAGVLGAGASTSWASLGVSLVAAILVDYALDWVVGWFYDPAAAIVTRVEQTLDEVGTLIIEGDGVDPGLKAELQTLARRRARLRHAALHSLIVTGS
jgi:hypothetical protein